MNQIPTFSADCFRGNNGLCGPLLTPNCLDDVPETLEGNISISSNDFEWNLISVEIGFGVGFGTLVVPLLFWNKWRELYFDRLKDIAFASYIRDL